MIQEIVPIRSIAQLRAQVGRKRGLGQRIGFVPTMGALHEGHLSLVRAAQARSDFVIVSIFVNPRQFSPQEDLDSYPRTEKSDLAQLADLGVDVVYAPDAREIYPDGFATSIQINGPAIGLESARRPHFFGGVAIVVTKLLMQSQPDIAIFGEKDFQQFRVIERLARDLDLPVEILAAPTIRDADGLALSSRNAYLTEPERRIAGRLNVILRKSVRALEAGAITAPELVSTEQALTMAGFDGIDYVALRDESDLSELPAGPVTKPARLLAAVRVGGKRLIDNFAVRAIG